MNKYCEFKVVDVIVRKKKQNKTENSNCNADCIVTKNNFSVEKRLTRSSKLFLNVSSSQNFLVQSCGENIYKADRQNKPLKRSSLNEKCHEKHRELQPTKKKRKDFNKTEKSSSSSKTSKRVFNPPNIEAFKKAKLFKIPTCENKVKKSQISRSKSYWENKLTGARRVSKRLTNLKTRNKANSVPKSFTGNIQNMVVKVVNEKLTKNKKSISTKVSSLKGNQKRISVTKICDLNRNKSERSSKYRNSKVTSNKKDPTRTIAARKKPRVTRTYRSHHKADLTEYFESNIDDESIILAEEETSIKITQPSSCTILENKVSTTTEENQLDSTSEIVFVDFDYKVSEDHCQTEQIDSQPEKENQCESNTTVVVLGENMLNDETNIMVVGIEPVAVVVHADPPESSSVKEISNDNLERKTQNVEDGQSTNLLNSLIITSKDVVIVSQATVNQQSENHNDDNKTSSQVTPDGEISSMTKETVSEEYLEFKKENEDFNTS